jgi:hypothetical protein
LTLGYLCTSSYPLFRILTPHFLQLHNGESIKAKGPRKTSYYRPVCIKTDKEAVPRYKFHHVEIAKNILTPNTMLNFIPHLRDIEPRSAEEKKYQKWIEELDSLDTQSGFKTMDRQSKLVKRKIDERAAVLSMYLDRWIRRLGIAECTKQTLIRHMTAKDDIPSSQKGKAGQQNEEPDLTYNSLVAKMFTEAFNRVFNTGTTFQGVALRDVLLLDKSLEVPADNKRVKDTPSSHKHGDKDLLSRVEGVIASYGILGCSICYAHDCEHGEFYADNQRRPISLDGNNFQFMLRRKWEDQVKAKARGEAETNHMLVQECKNHCFRKYDVGNPMHPLSPWTQSQIDVLEAIFATLGHSDIKAQCSVAAILGKKCWEVHRRMKEMNLHLPPVKIHDPPKIKAVSWYDRKKKQLLGDWKENTVTHQHAHREIKEPCHHEGPCDDKCPCFSATPLPVLCDRFCHCTAETCPIKFTGCACHATGKTCLERQKEGRPCICVQLNRECDPELCRGCGADTRADPENAHDEALHSHGCQNVALQRGAAKKLVLGQSQLEGCGYGLFTAEDINQDEFVIEYTGEIITHDEGVRREARRGNVFEEESNSSYLFTLLEHEGIWVDAAIYGNLSRYINHASESDRKGCNITPKILFVNGEYRIRFTALRDIKAGEELFFNYGDNFPNLTKKLLAEDQNKENGADKPNTQKSKNSRSRAPNAKAGAKSAAKEAIKGQARGKTTKSASRTTRDGDVEMLDWNNMENLLLDEDDVGDEYEDQSPRRAKRKKRGGARPGAGRKPKNKTVTVPGVVGGGDDKEAEKKPATDADLRLEVSDSQEDASDKPGSVETPSPLRRQSARNRPSASFRRSRLSGVVPGSGSDAEMVVTPKQELYALQPDSATKPVSRRGGARPGAGRKPKKKPQPQPSTPAAGTNGSTGVGGGNGESGVSSGATGGGGGGDAVGNTQGDEDGLASTSKATNEAPAHADASADGSAAARRAHKRRISDALADSDVEMEDASPAASAGRRAYVNGRFVPMDPAESHRDRDRERVKKSMSSDDGDDDEDDDDDDMADRSSRKRQKPLRYRDEGGS